jgi:hypothetical protein
MTKIEQLLESLAKIQDDWKVNNRRKFPRLDTVEREIDCDTDKLYHSDLGVTISYLQEINLKHPTASLDEKWTGYEDMYMRFIYYTPESDDEYERRLQGELVRQQYDRKMRDEHKRKSDIQAQIDALRKKL